MGPGCTLPYVLVYQSLILNATSCIDFHAHMYTSMHTHTLTLTYSHKYTLSLSHTHIYSHMYTLIFIHTHTYIFQAPSFSIPIPSLTLSVHWIVLWVFCSVLSPPRQPCPRTPCPQQQIKDNSSRINQSS